MDEVIEGRKNENKIQVKKNEYLNLLKSKNNNQNNITLHQSLKIYYHDDKTLNTEPSKNSNSINLSINHEINNNNLKEVKTPLKSIKKICLKGNFLNKNKGKIIYNNSRKDSSKIKKDTIKENNNDKENLTTSTTSPITTPVKGNNDNNDNFNTIFFSGNSNKRAFNHYEKNILRYSDYNLENNFIFDSKPENNTIQITHRIKNPFEDFNEPFLNNEYNTINISRNQINNYSYNFNNYNSYNNPNYNINNNMNSNINNNNFNNNNINNFTNNVYNNKSEDLILNVEDLIMIEVKFSKLITNVNDENINVVSKTCYEWWNFYFNCSLKGNYDYLFREPRNKNVVSCYNSLLLISIMLIYDLSFKQKLFKKMIKYIEEVLFLSHQNFLNICQYLISRIKTEYLNSKWVEQLKEIISSQIERKKFYFYEIDQNLQSLNKHIQNLIHITKEKINPKIEIIYKNFMKYNSEEINKIFMTNILQIDNQGGSLLFSLTKFNNPIINDFFLKNKPNKPLTLVLDLDETLMSFVYITENKKEGLLRLRPFIYNFLNLVKEYYEIIIFTAATKSYADPILDAIEIIKGKYFNHRLYRNHCSIVNNVIVKDISLIGRDINKMIIVDNMQQNFKLQKDNGILISSFWGDDNNDKSLLHLGKILVSIATDMIELNNKCDIRDEIKKYKDEILRNVSMN